jgi:hypothetical protein
MGQTAKALRELWRKRYEFILDVIFEEYAAEDITLLPDEAMASLERVLEKLVNDTEQSTPNVGVPRSVDVLRFNRAAYRREAHHYAVDRFYKTYFPRKRGGEPLPEAYLDRILGFRFKGLNYVAIAKELGQPRDRVRKQVEAAEKRWQEAVEKIEQIKRRSPHLAAPIPEPPKPKKGRTR